MTSEALEATARPLFTWKVIWPDGEVGTVQGHDIQTYAGSDALRIVRYEPSGRERLVMMINPAHVAAVMDVTNPSTP